jgi:hypothetical protein
LAKEVSNRPSAHILVEAIRSIGYTFESALSDIIDNSISAEANRIDIDLRLVPRNMLQIVDDGFGMSRDELFSAMRYGSSNPNHTRATNDLGRFGLGLKSASLSQCRKLTVISKQSGNISGFCWDLDVIERYDDWMLLELDKEEIAGYVKNSPAFQTHATGTQVIWENFDRIEAHAKTLSDTLTELLNASERYVSLIYHRFSSDGLKVHFNGNQVKWLDPFLTHHKTTARKKEQTLAVDGSKIDIRPFILPHKSYLSKDDIDKLGGLDQLKNSQGFYVYRNRRLIIWGTWFRMSVVEELNKLARIQIDIPNTLDHIWSIDVKKSTASLPDKIRKQLVFRVKESIEGSNQVYKTRTIKERDDGESIWSRHKDRDGNIQYYIDPESTTVKAFTRTLSENQMKSIETMLRIISENFPYDKAYYDHNKDHVKMDVTDSELVDRAWEMYQYLRDLGHNHDEIINHFSNSHQFAKLDPTWLGKVLKARDCDES